MNHTTLIKNEKDHAEALTRVSELMDKNPVSGSEEGDELEVLVLLIERYEQEKFPIDKPDPIEAINFRTEQQGLRKKI